MAASRKLTKRMERAVIITAFVTVVVLIICANESLAQTKLVKEEKQKGYVPAGHGKLRSDQSEIVKLYDRDGRILEESGKRFFPPLNKVISYTKRNFYGVNGRLDSALTSSSDASSMKLVMLYDSTGRESGIQEYTGDGKPSFKSIYVFNIANQKTRQEMYDIKGALFNLKNFTYDKQDNLVQEAGTEQGQPRYRWSYEYDTHNRLTKREDYSSDGNLIRTHRYDYNAEGRIVKETIIGTSGKTEQIVKYTYEFF